GEQVVVHDGGVLVRPGDAVDVEGAVVGEEPERDPHPGGLDQHVHALADHEVLVIGGPHVLHHGVGDVRVDVILRGAGLIVGGGLFTVDGAPRVEGALDGEVLR